MSLCSVFFQQLLDMKIFVDTDSDIRLVRRLRRDITERGRDIDGVIKQYNKFVKPAFEQYIEPTMRLADIVVPRGTNVCKYMCFCYFTTLAKYYINLKKPKQKNNIFSCLSFAQVVATWWPLI